MSYIGTGVGYIMSLYTGIRDFKNPQEQIEFLENALKTNKACEPYESPEFPGKILYREKNHENDFIVSSCYEPFMKKTKGLVINYPGRCGWTILGVCADYGYLELAQWIIEHGGNPMHCTDLGESIEEIAENSKHNLSQEQKEGFRKLQEKYTETQTAQTANRFMEDLEKNGFDAVIPS